MALLVRGQWFKPLLRHVHRLEAVEVVFDMRFDAWNPCVNAEVFSSMNKLRLFLIEGRFTESEPTHLPHELRWFYWAEYPFESFSFSTATGGTSKLVHLDMRYSNFKQLLLGPMIMLPNLKVIDLSYSGQLERFPDVTGVPNLERLILEECTSLVEVHESVGCLKRLVHWDMSGCDCLEILPTTIHMKSLQTLILSRCKSLERFPDISGEMGSLSKLYLVRCWRLKKLPSSIRFLTGLTSLDLNNCISLQSLPNSMFDLKLLTTLDLGGCINLQTLPAIEHLQALHLSGSEIREEDFPCNLHNAWPLLEVLDLSYNQSLTRLPGSICHISHLKVLELNCCKKLEELGELPSGIQVLEARACESLKRIDDLSSKYKWLHEISLFGCKELLENHEESQSHIDNLLQRSFVQKWAAMNHPLSVTVPGSKVPDWFSNRQQGNKIALELPSSWHTKITGFAICAVVPGPILLCDTYITVKFKRGVAKELIYKPFFDQNLSARKGEYVWIGFIPLDFVQKVYHDFQPGDWSLTEGYPVISLLHDTDDILECGGCIIYKEEVEHMNSGKLKNDEHMTDVCTIEEDDEGYKTIKMKL